MNKKAERILNAAITLFIKNGIKKTTMDEIAETSNVSKVTIYKYFLDKDNLCYEIGKYIFSQYEVRLNNATVTDKPITDKLYSCLNIVSEFTNSNRWSLCNELAKYNKEISMQHHAYLKIYKNTIMSLIDEGKNNQLIRKDIDREIIFYYIDMGVAYYQQNDEYRNKMLSDTDFKNKFMMLIVSSIFVDGKKLLDKSGNKLEQSVLQYYISLAKEGTRTSIDIIMKDLNSNMTIEESKFIDFALGNIDNEDGIRVMEYYLFHGTQIQRNYCTLYFSRRGDHLLVKEAYDKGVIDEIQAFAR